MNKHWPKVRLSEVLKRSEETITLLPDAEYREITVRLWGKGVVQRRVVIGAELASQRRYVARRGQFILSRIDSRNGALGIVPLELDCSIVTNDFPVFNVVEDLLLVGYLGWMCQTAAFVEECRRASEGTTNRVRLQEDNFLTRVLPLPPLPEQRRVVARIDEVAAHIDQVRRIRAEIEAEQGHLLRAAYNRIVMNAPRQRLADIAPLVRRPVAIHIDKQYPQIAVRSFGRGTFHKPPLVGSEVTWQKPFLVKTGDILISNIKAWEGAVAVAAADDDGRVGSHRYLTLVPKAAVATAHFVCFHLLTPEGLRNIGEASPGSADRNRTLNVKELLEIPIPVPAFEQQLWFNQVGHEVDAIKRLQTETAAELDAFLPAILDRAFNGEL